LFIVQNSEVLLLQPGHHHVRPIGHNHIQRDLPVRTAQPRSLHRTGLYLRGCRRFNLLRNCGKRQAKKQHRDPEQYLHHNPPYRPLYQKQRMKIYHQYPPVRGTTQPEFQESSTA